MFEDVIKKVLEKNKGKDFSRQQIINDLFDDDFLKQKFVNEIRRATTVGVLANEIFKRLGIKDECKIMAIGDMKYFADTKKKWQSLVKKSLNEIDSSKLFSYDMNGQGSEELSNCLFDYMKLYYDFSGIDYDIKSNIIPCYGSTDGLVMILDTFRQRFFDKKINFVYPEASFMASISIAKSYGFNTISLDKASKSDFFISKDQVKEFYDKEKNSLNIYYFTPVGNPTGEKIDGKELFELMNFILDFDEEAIFILDNVYVGLLEKEISYDMFSLIFKDKNLFSRIVFCESLSKTFGATGLRLAWIWTINQDFSISLKKNITLKKAGYSKILDQFIVNLFSNLDEINLFQQEEFEFISKQRLDFIKFMKDKFSRFFDFDLSSKVKKREGIYTFLKIKDGYDAKQIFAETLIIGVPVTLSDGNYIRYSFGNTNYF